MPGKSAGRDKRGTRGVACVAASAGFSDSLLGQAIARAANQLTLLHTLKIGIRRPYLGRQFYTVAVIHCFQTRHPD
jgi:hypothetical protein